MDDVRVSKLLSRVLRHDPSSVGIVLDRAGWVPVGDLVSALTSKGHPGSAGSRPPQPACRALAADEQTAHRRGARRGAHVVLAVDAVAMHRDGHAFTVAANGVWLVEHVPPRYVRRLPDDAPWSNPTGGVTGGWPYLGEPEEEENPW